MSDRPVRSDRSDNDSISGQSQSCNQDQQPQPQACENPLEAYFIEQAKLFEHLEARHQQFVQRVQDEKSKSKGKKTPTKVTSKPPKSKNDSSKPKKESVKPVNQAAEQATASIPAQEKTSPTSRKKADTIGSRAAATDLAAPNNAQQAKKAVAASPEPSHVQQLPQKLTENPTMSIARSRVPALVDGVASQLHRRAIHSSSSRAAQAADKKAAPNPDALPLNEAVRLLRALEIGNPSSTYNVNISVHTTKSSLPLRGMVSLPHSVKRKPEVTLVFAEPDSPSAQAAQEAGANHVGGEDLFAKVLSGDIKPTKVWATPGLMPEVARKMARYLGPKGLMPVAKRGGVAEGQDLAKRIRDSATTTEWKADKIGAIRFPVAKMTFPLEDVEENVRAFITEVKNRSASVAAEAADASTSRKRSKDPFGIITARLETTLGPSVELTNVA